MDQEIDYVLSAIRMAKITDIDSLKEIFHSFLRAAHSTPKLAALLATKLFDPTASFCSELETRSSIGDALTRGVKKAICRLSADFLKAHQRLVQDSLNSIYVG